MPAFAPQVGKLPPRAAQSKLMSGGSSAGGRLAGAGAAVPGGAASVAAGAAVAGAAAAAAGASCSSKQRLSMSKDSKARANSASSPPCAALQADGGRGRRIRTAGLGCRHVGGGRGGGAAIHNQVLHCGVGSDTSFVPAAMQPGRNQGQASMQRRARQTSPHGSLLWHRSAVAGGCDSLGRLMAPGSTLRPQQHVPPLARAPGSR